MRRIAALMGAVAALAGCGSARETPEQAEARIAQESAAFKTALKGIENRWEAFSAAGQGDSIASLFMEDGRNNPPNEPAQVGRAAIAKAEAAQNGLYTFSLSILSEDAAANGPIGVEHGTYGVEGKVKKGAPKGVPAKFSDHGNYLIHWHNVNGTWQVADLVFTSSQTTPMGAAIMAAVKKATPRPTAKPAAKPAARKPTTRRR